MSTIRFPFKGLFGKVAAAFRHKNRRPTESHAFPAKPAGPVISLPEKRGGLARWLFVKDNPRNLSPGGKELMLQLAEEKRERRRARNRRLAGIA